jgi:hypothetical protein
VPSCTKCSLIFVWLKACAHFGSRPEGLLSQISGCCLRNLRYHFRDSFLPMTRSTFRSRVCLLRGRAISLWCSI